MAANTRRVRLKTSLVGERFEAHAGDVIETTIGHAAVLLERDLAEPADDVEVAAFQSPELAVTRVGRPAGRRRG